MPIVNRFTALVSLVVIALTAVALAQNLSISVSPTQLTLYGGDPQIEKITAYGTGPVLVLPSDDQCDKTRLVNVVGGKSTHEGGALVTSSTYVLFLQAKRESGECAITFAVDTLGHGRVVQTMHVRVLPVPKVSITASPPELSLAMSQPMRRLTVTALGTSLIDLLNNTCSGARPIASIVSSITKSSTEPGKRSATETLDVLARRRGDCTMTFWSNDVSESVKIHVDASQ